MKPSSDTVTSRHGGLFWGGVVVGGAAMVFGFTGLMDHQRGDQVVNWLTFLVGLDLAHDLLLAPLACVAGAGLARALPHTWRAPMQAGLLAGGAVLLVAALPLRHTADQVGNPTIQPLDYGAATLTALAIVWGVVLAASALSGLRTTRAQRPKPPPPPPE